MTSLFTLAFAPILGFLRLTMNEVSLSDSAYLSWHDMAVPLLVCALAAGIGQLFRLLRGEPALRGLGPSLGLVLIPWLALYLVITVRLASVLGLIASGSVDVAKSRDAAAGVRPLQISMGRSTARASVCTTSSSSRCCSW